MSTWLVVLDGDGCSTTGCYCFSCDGVTYCFSSCMLGDLPLLKDPGWHTLFRPGRREENPQRSDARSTGNLFFSLCVHTLPEEYKVLESTANPPPPYQILRHGPLLATPPGTSRCLHPSPSEGANELCAFCLLSPPPPGALFYHACSCHCISSRASLLTVLAGKRFGV